MNKIIRNIIFSFLMIFSVVKPNEIESVSKNEEFKAKLIKAISSNNLEEVKDIASTAEFSNFISSSSNNFAIAIEEALSNLKSYESKKSLLKNIVAGVLFAASLFGLANTISFLVVTNEEYFKFVGLAAERACKMLHFNSTDKEAILKEKILKDVNDLFATNKARMSFTIFHAALTLLFSAATAKVFKSIYEEYKNATTAKQILKILELSKSSNSQQSVNNE